VPFAQAEAAEVLYAQPEAAVVPFAQPEVAVVSYAQPVAVVAPFAQLAAAPGSGRPVFRLSGAVAGRWIQAGVALRVYR
jgi:hypothetical protein